MGPVSFEASFTWMAPKQNHMLAAPRMSSSNRGVINTCLWIIRVPNFASGLICSSTDSAELQTKKKKKKTLHQQKAGTGVVYHTICAAVCAEPEWKFVI